MKFYRLPPLLLQTLPIFTAFAFTACLIAAFDLREAVVALILGVIAGGLADMDHRAGGRVRNMLIILPVFGLSALLTQVLQGSPLFLLLFMALLAFATTMLGALDSRFRTIAFCSLVVAIYTLLADNAALAWYLNPLLIMLGTLICQLSMLGFQLLFPNHPVQQSLAASFLALANYMESKAVLFLPDEAAQLQTTQYRLAELTGQVAEAFNHSRDVLFKRLAGSRLSAHRRRQLQDFFNAQDIHERISASHADYSLLLQKLNHSDLLFRIERLIRLQAQTCRLYAQALREETDFTPPPSLARAEAGLSAAWQYHAPQHADLPELPLLLRNLQRISAQLQTLGQLDHRQDSAARQQDDLQNSHLVDWRHIPSRLRSHLRPESPFFRHAVRMATLSGISIAIIESLNLAQGYWILLTAVFVCQPNRAATKRKLIQRIIGTLLGVFIGSLLPLFAPERITLLSLLVIANTCFFYFRARNYSFSTFFITVQVFLGFALTGIDMGGAVWQRIFDTLAGAAIAWVCVQFIFPEQRYQSLKRLIQQALNANADYLSAIATQLSSLPIDDLAYRSKRRRVHEQAAALAAFATEQGQSQAMQAVQENYRLISRLSALAAHRGQNSPQDVQPLLSLAEFMRQTHNASSADIAALAAQAPQWQPLMQAAQTLWEAPCNTQP